jgi:hypothetical protein
MKNLMRINMPEGAAQQLVERFAKDGRFVAYEPWPDGEAAVYVKMELRGKIGGIIDEALGLQDGEYAEIVQIRHDVELR